MKISLEKIVIGSGVWLVILPFTGFPHGVKTVLTILTGIVVVYVGALIWKRERNSRVTTVVEIKTETFTEVA